MKDDAWLSKSRAEWFIQFEYPCAPAKGKTDTSFDAAEAVVAPNTWRKRIYKAIKDYSPGLTAEEIGLVIGKSGMGALTVRPRVTELSQQGLIEDSGERRKNGSGRNAIVWRIKE